jgi:predicted phage tail protein
VYYFRIHTIANGVKSRASSEIRVHVDVPAGPTAPANLLGAVNGTNLALSWRNTYGGGAPSSIVLDVTGPVTTALTLGVTDTFTFSGVPPGQYTFTVRAVNAAGSSGSSNPLTLTFPTTCSGAPQTPINFFVAVNGNNVSANWWPAATGAAVTRYEVNVTGTMTARLPVVGRTIGGAVPPGTYNVSVRAANACGNSAYTAVRTVTVR